MGLVEPGIFTPTSVYPELETRHKLAAQLRLLTLNMVVR